MISTASVAAALFASGFVLASPALANSTDEVRRAFDRFVAAQNAHDLDGVASLLADGPGFMWVTRGTVVKGRAAAISRFRDLYRGPWRLRADGTPVVGPSTPRDWGTGAACFSETSRCHEGSLNVRRRLMFGPRLQLAADRMTCIREALLSSSGMWTRSRRTSPH